jgi:hypothetical protein
MDPDADGGPFDVLTTGFNALDWYVSVAGVHSFTRLQIWNTTTDLWL